MKTPGALSPRLGLPRLGDLVLLNDCAGEGLVETLGCVLTGRYDDREHLMFHRVTAEGFPGNLVSRPPASLQGHALAFPSASFSGDVTETLDLSAPLPSAASDTGVSPADTRPQTAFCLWMSVWPRA